MNNPILQADGFILQKNPMIYVSALSGKWLLKHTTPTWRIKDPELGFQRIVRETRAREIALAVLDQKRTFPNAIVLATNIKEFVIENGKISMPSEIFFLVVDGQHRLWAQQYSAYDATYACLIHTGLNEIQMAQLFLEINDNQKRVPSSLRWDLVRLVRPDDNPDAVAAAEMVYLLATDEDSPLYQRIDLTGEQYEIQLKQGSLAPEIKSLISKNTLYGKLPFESQYQILVQYIISIRELDRDQWGQPEYPLYKARVFRVLIRLLPEMVRILGSDPNNIKYQDFFQFLKKIDIGTLATENIISAQGSAGMKAIYTLIYTQIMTGD